MKAYLIGITLEPPFPPVHRFVIVFEDETCYYYNQDGWRKNNLEDLQPFRDKKCSIIKEIENADDLKDTFEDKFLNDKEPYDLLNYNCVAAIWNIVSEKTN